MFASTVRSLSETFVTRSLLNSSSGSCHGIHATWQEIGRVCVNALVSVHRTLSLHSDEYHLLATHWATHTRPVSCHVASLPWQEPEEELNKVLLPVWVPGLKIDPLRLLAGCHKRRLNQASFNLRSLIWLLMMEWSKRGNINTAALVTIAQCNTLVARCSRQLIGSAYWFFITLGPLRCD